MYQGQGWCLRSVWQQSWQDHRATLAGISVVIFGPRGLQQEPTHSLVEDAGTLKQKE